MRSRRPRSSQHEGKEKGRAPHLFSMRILHAPIGAPPPFFLREEFSGDAFGLAFLGVAKLGCAAASRERIGACRKRTFSKDISAFSKDRLWRDDDPREAFRGGSRSKSGWRAHRACATIWSGARSAICWDRSASAPKSLAAGSAHAAATTRARAAGGFGALRRSSPRHCGTNGAGSSA